MFGQTLSSLTLTKPRIQGKNGQREYIVIILYRYGCYNSHTFFFTNIRLFLGMILLKTGF
jgi:hypothetical protein